MDMVCCGSSSNADTVRDHVGEKGELSLRLDLSSTKVRANPHFGPWVSQAVTKRQIFVDTSGRNKLLHRAAGLEDEEVRSSVIWEELRIGRLLPIMERSQLKLFGYLIRIPSPQVQVAGAPGVDLKLNGGIIYLI